MKFIIIIISNNNKNNNIYKINNTVRSKRSIYVSFQETQKNEAQFSMMQKSFRVITLSIVVVCTLLSESFGIVAAYTYKMTFFRSIFSFFLATAPPLLTIPIEI